MSKSKNALFSQEIGLRLALIFGSYLYNIKQLHFGYWSKEMKLELSNLSKAQAGYCELLKSVIPVNVKTILDVGCGTGALAQELLAAGYTVDCVTPSNFFTSLIASNTDGKSEIFQTTFEELKTDKKYDMILFSESFQYIEIEKGFEKAMGLLNDNGHILISDYFKKDKKMVSGKSPLSGGHKLVKFNELMKNLPLSEIKHLDITEQTAPNLDLVNDLLNNLALPAIECLVKYVKAKNLYNFACSVSSLIFRKKIENLQRKYFRDERNAENFKKYKQYLVLLYKLKLS